MVNNQCFISMTRAKRKPSTMGRFKAACTFAAELIPTGLLTGCAIFDFFGKSMPTPDKLMSLRRKPAVAIYVCVLFGAQAAPAFAGHEILAGTCASNERIAALTREEASLGIPSPQQGSAAIQLVGGLLVLALAGYSLYLRSMLKTTPGPERREQ